MKVLKAKQEQKDLIESLTNGNNLIRFILDADDKWVVGTEVIHNGNHLSIRGQLLELEEIDYNPIILGD